MSYWARIASLDYSRSLATPAARRVVLLTGQSSFQSSRLTADQRRLLRVVDAEPVELGFPFHPDFDVDAPEPGIVEAALRNARQFQGSLRPQPVIAQALQPVFANTGERLFVITGSCGLQLLNSAWQFLQRPAGLEVRIVALGPAALRNTLPAATIQGRRDLWSRLLFRGPISAYCDCGHLDYWGSEEVHKLVRDACA